MSSEPVGSPSGIGYYSEELDSRKKNSLSSTNGSPSDFDSSLSIIQQQRQHQFAALSAASNIRSPDSKRKKIVKKLSFWRKEETDTKDLHASLKKLVSSHDQYRKDLHSTITKLNEWSEFMDPPSMISKDLMQNTLQQKSISQWMASVVDAVKPVTDKERKLTEVYSALMHAFEIMKNDEALFRKAFDKQSHAEKKFFQALASNCNYQEAEFLDSLRNQQLNEVTASASRFHQTCKRELPIRFSQLCSYYEEMVSEQQRTVRSLQGLAASDTMLAESDEYHTPFDTRTASLRTQTQVPPLASTNAYPGTYLPQISPRGNALPTPMESPEEDVYKNEFEYGKW